MRLERSTSRRRWALRGGLSLGLFALVLALGIPLQRGCGGEPECAAVIESSIRSPAAGQLAARVPTVIYLNRSGATVVGGQDDASHDTSSVVAGFKLAQVTVPPAALDEASWQTVVECVRSEFSRFNVSVVDERPSQSGYAMVVVGGSGAELGVGLDSRGDAPFDKDGCQTVNGAVAFVFSDKLGSNPWATCEVAAHELAHVFSVDHELLAADAMSYLAFTGHRVFQDLDAPCGETVERPCACGRASQNPVEILTQKLGAAPSMDTSPPQVSAEANQPRPGFLAVTVHAVDPSGIATVSLAYRDEKTFVLSTCGDGQASCVVNGSEYIFSIGGVSGHASYRATVVDAAGNPATTPMQELSVDDSAAGPSPVAFKVAASVSAGLATARATITSSGSAIKTARLYWTDSRGVTSSRELCPSGPDEWSRPVQLAPAAGARSFVVVATDADGRTATSPVTSVTQ